MKVDDSLYASVSQMELVHIINRPNTFNVPNAPEYCKNIIIWNDNILPVIDFSCVFNKARSSANCDVVAVIIYRNCNNEIQYGGISLAVTPELEFVDNKQMCKLPDYTGDLQSISLSCFISKEGHEVPILDMSKMFSIKYSEELIRQNC